MRKNLTKNEILRNKYQIAELFKHSGNDDTQLKFRGSVQHAGLKLIFNTRSDIGADDQLFLSPVKLLGSAAQRNRAKRLQRELYRHSKQQLRHISWRVAISALNILQAKHFMYGNAHCEKEDFRMNILHLEQQLVYHWAFVIYRPAYPVENIELLESFRIWQGASDPLFLGEIQRYQFLLSHLEKSLRKQWFEFLRNAKQSEILH